MKANLLDWLLERIGLVIFVVIFVVQILRGLFQASRAAPPPSTSKPDALEEERRVQDVQAEIRRRIAERRGGGAPASAPEAPVAPEPPPAPEPPTADPFEPLRRMMRDLEDQARDVERKISGEEQPAPAAAPPPVMPAAVSARAAELERQRLLAEQLAAVQAERVAGRRRAEEATAAVAERAVAARAPARLMEDLRDPAALRRAVLLREVLGTPVGLR